MTLTTTIPSSSSSSSSSPTWTSSMNFSVEEVRNYVSTQVACVQALVEIEQGGRKLGKNREDVHGIVQVAQAQAPDPVLGFTFLSSKSFEDRVLTMSAMQPGIAEVYQEILDQATGAEIYLHSMWRCPWLQEVPIRELDKYFSDGVMLGWVMEEEGKEQRVSMDPMLLNSDATLPLNARVILLTHNKSIFCLRKPIPSFLSIHQNAAEVEHDWPRQVEDSNKSVHHILVLNFYNQNDLFLLFDTPRLAGSKIVFLTQSPPPFPKNSSFVTFEFVQGSSLRSEDLARIPIDKLTTVVILEYHVNDAILAESDARIVTSMMLLAQLRRQRSPSLPAPPLHYVASVQLSTSMEVVKATAAEQEATATLVLFNELESGALVQILWNPDLLEVYRDLLEPSWGGQMRFLGIEEVLGAGHGGAVRGTTNFAYIQERMGRVNQVALGMMKGDGSFRLAPSKFETLHIEEGMMIIAFGREQ
mmetsp:Transcript_22308/g.73341  ORF Transcript_22308/g.73341 Transcript_22308/m.73341 type:complete len:473 (-) Transcript_22308:18-1436(-)